MLNRPDPFFNHSQPHKKSFLESLHRTYGQPPGGLPQRDDNAFKRALEFRHREKAQYQAMEMSNQQLQAEVARLSAVNKDLQTETGEIRTLWEQLSKGLTIPDNDATADPTSSADGEQPVELKQKCPPKRRGGKASVHTGSAGNDSKGDGVVQPSEDRADSGRGVGFETDDEEGQRGSGGGESVRREILPTGSLPDTRRSASQHTAEGPEHGGGVESTSAERGSVGAVREDEG